MARREFNRKTRNEVHARAAGHCEGCGAVLKQAEGEYDHILPDQLGGDPVASNCRLLCRQCHKAKTAADIRTIRHNGTKRRNGPPMAGTIASGWRKPINGPAERRGLWPPSNTFSEETD